MTDNTISDDLLPKYFFDRITDITPADFAAMGAKAVAIDIDNTIADDGAFHLFHGVRAWVKRIQAAGIQVVILTNTFPLRAKFISRLLGRLPYVANAEKPRQKGFQKAADLLGIPIGEMAMVGDQLFTDIRGANEAGAIPVRVKFRRPELLGYFHYRKLRHKEKKFLISKGHGDKL